MLISTHFSGHTLHLVTFRHVFMYTAGVVAKLRFSWIFPWVFPLAPKL